MTLDKIRQDIIDSRPGLKEYLDQTEPKRRLALELMAARKRAGLTRDNVVVRSGISMEELEALEAPAGDMPSEVMIGRFLAACK